MRIPNNRNKTLLLVAVSASLMPALLAPAGAGVILSINDLGDSLSAIATGPAHNVSYQIGTETSTHLGMADSAFEFFSASPLLPGQVNVLTYNIMDPGPAGQMSSIISDTLSITLTGHTPGFLGDDNMSADIHFRSDGVNNLLPPALFGGVSVLELSQWQTVPSGNGDLTVRFASAPDAGGTLALFGLGITAMFGAQRKLRGLLAM